MPWHQQRQLYHGHVTASGMKPSRGARQQAKAFGDTWKKDYEEKIC